MPELSTLSLASDANLVAYYRFNTGALTTDSKGSNTLTNNNTVGEAAGIFGVCANFGNSNTNKSLTRSSDLGITSGAISIALWVKLNAEIASGFWVLAAKGDAGTHTSYYMGYDYNSGTRRLQFTRLIQGVAQHNVFYNITLGTANFYHLVMTYNTSNIIAYVNGVAVSTPTASTGNGTADNFDNFTIGCGFNAGTNALENYGSVLVDDVAIFNDALTPTEIAQIYRQGSPALFYAQL